jgi:diguanylate cyclase (GGDEF)-like protein
MKLFKVDLEALLTVAAAVIDADGVLLDANAGFARLLPASFTKSMGAKVSRFFIQPNFAMLIAPGDGNVSGNGNGSGNGSGIVTYTGLMTIGDYSGRTRTLRGKVWRTDIGIRVFAEYDIDELEKLNDTMLDLHRQSSVAQHALMRANVTLKQREVQTLEASLTDTLTGLGNRRKLDQAVAVEIDRIRRHGGTLSAIMMDIDHFKGINDRYGHGAGDKVLARMGAIFRTNTRSTDIVARFGGEEFMILMPHTVIVQAAVKAEQLRGAISGEIIEPLIDPVTASFGVAELSTLEEAESFFERVDMALYSAKKSGRNRVCLATNGA